MGPDRIIPDAASPTLTGAGSGPRGTGSPAPSPPRISTSSDLSNAASLPSSSARMAANCPRSRPISPWFSLKTVKTAASSPVSSLFPRAGRRTLPSPSANLLAAWARARTGVVILRTMTMPTRVNRAKIAPPPPATNIRAKVRASSAPRAAAAKPSPAKVARPSTLGII